MVDEQQKRSDPGPDSGTPSGASTAGSRKLLILALGALTLLGIALGMREITSPDLGFHLATARWMLEHGQVPRTDFLSYTVSDHAYIDLQWLYQLVVLGLLSLGGSAALVVLTTLLTLAFGALLLLRSWRRDGRVSVASLILVLVFFLGTQWEPRPHLFSWIFGALLLWILEEHERRPGRLLAFLPLVMVLWVNTHSLFVLGLVILAVHVSVHLGRRLFREGVALDRPLLLWSGVAVLACLVNPYHVKGLLFPLVQFADIQGASAYKAADTGISEFQSPLALSGYRIQGHFVLFQELLWWQLFALLVALGLWRARKRTSPVEWVLIAAFFYVFLSANKNFGYFVMVVFPAVAAGEWRLRRRTALATVAVAALCLAGLTWSGRLYDLAWSANRRGVSFDSAVLPVEEAAFLRERGIEGRLLNTWDDGGYLAWATGQPVAVYSHGEVMGQAFYRRYVQAKEPQGFEAALAEWQPTVAVVPFQSADYWLYQLSRNRDWRLVLANEHRAVFLHRSLAPEVPALASPRPGSDYPVFEGAERERVVRACAAKPPAGLSAWLRGAAAYPSHETARAGFYLQAGHVEAAIGTALAGLQRTPHAAPDLLLTLGHGLNARREYELADLCFDAFQRNDPDPVLARGIAQARGQR